VKPRRFMGKPFGVWHQRAARCSIPRFPYKGQTGNDHQDEGSQDEGPLPKRGVFARGCRWRRWRRGWHCVSDQTFLNMKRRQTVHDLLSERTIIISKGKHCLPSYILLAIVPYALFSSSMSASNAATALCCISKAFPSQWSPSRGLSWTSLSRAAQECSSSPKSEKRRYGQAVSSVVAISSTTQAVAAASVLNSATALATASLAASKATSRISSSERCFRIHRASSSYLQTSAVLRERVVYWYSV
jgi:hypothetical protein